MHCVYFSPDWRGYLVTRKAGQHLPDTAIAVLLLNTLIYYTTSIVCVLLNLYICTL